MRLDLKMDSVARIDRADFDRLYVNPGKPLLIRGGLLDAQPASKNWSLLYLSERIGHHSVDVYDNRNPKHRMGAIMKPDLTMTFAEFLETTHQPNSPFRLFLFDLYKLDPQLKKEFWCPDLFRGALGNIAYTFFGGCNTDVKIHYDIDYSAVLMTQFGGRKRVVLFPPQESIPLYRLPFNVHSLVEVSKPDYASFPALDFARGYDVIMEPGDTLYMPPGFWHYNTYLEPGFAVSFRRLSPHPSDWVKGIINLLVNMPIDKSLTRALGAAWLEWKKEKAKQRANRWLQQQNLPHWEVLN